METYSRRGFAKIAALISTGSSLPFFNEAALAQSALRVATPGAVMINANENPLGPCPEALAALGAAAKKGGRYSLEETAKLRRIVAEQEQLKPYEVQTYAGSGDPLVRAVCAFCSRGRSFVLADPGYEAGMRAAEFMGAEVHRVPLTKDHAHDVRAMIGVDANPGLFYICNPNNPTGTLTPREDIDYLVAHKPKDAVVLLDEAYIHFSGAEPAVDLVRSGREIIILRTFSKLYGMAGLRAGLAFGRPDLLEKLSPYGSSFMPVTAMAAAAASLGVRDLVVERRKINRDVRERTFDFLARHKFSFLPSVSNKFMLDAQRPAHELAGALAQENIIVGRTWPVWPNHLRVTIGTRDEMEQFQQALLKVTA
ncbi:MAG TPA: pyridoxal phosphate-dependent aminotransferase [Bryobacteraceae bacterium]|nr:pyridoxal phosphate-dependent aminotransferase [Bryobacteraceae bacterium]